MPSNSEKRTAWEAVTIRYGIKADGFVDTAIAGGFASNGAKVFITGRRGDVLEAAAKELDQFAKQGGAVLAYVFSLSPSYLQTPSYPSRTSHTFPNRFVLPIPGSTLCLDPVCIRRLIRAGYKVM